MNKLKALREAAKLSQAKLAKKIGVSQPQVRRFELEPGHKDYRKIPSEKARLIAKALDVSVYEITGSLDAAADGLTPNEKARFARMIEAYRTEH